MKWNSERLNTAFKKAKAINAQHGKSYFFAARLFPKEIRNAVHVLYAFFRLPDEIVDSSSNLSEKEIVAKLEAWESEWQNAYQCNDIQEDVLYATSYIFHYYHIPFSYSVSFLKAMKQDLVKSYYSNFEELETYMYGSAGVVGIMLTYVVGFREKRALDYALKLGYAMQLTNFLRDIKEDWQLRHRIYMPQTELKAFGLSVQNIMQQNFSTDFDSFITWQISRARSLYREADVGILLLNPRGQLAVKVASRLYEAILDRIAAQKNNVFLKRAKTSFLQKIWILLKCIVWK